MTPDIFLSYTREDQASAQRFAEAFEAQGWSVWWDVTLRSGEAYDQVTEEALSTAKAVVVLWSLKSVVSRWVRAEATLADRNRTLVPAMIEPCQRPIMFELTQTADLSHWAGEADDSSWRAFLADVRRFVETEAAPQTPAPRPSAQGASAPPSRTARPALAVLPFINRSGREADDLFAEDMVEDLTAALSRSQWMKVVAASAAAAYRNGARDLRKIGRDLGARYLLEGNIRRAGEDLRVTAQLVEAESGNILWLQRFGRPLGEVSALQDELVAEVAAHLHEQVHRAEIEHALKKRGDVSIWEAAMRADAYSAHATRKGYEAAVAEHRRALELDPNDAMACAFLASGQGMLLRFQGGDVPELEEEIVANIRRARALEPDNPLVLHGIASALNCLGKAQDALPLAERAVAINPSLEIPHIVLGSVLVRLGRSDDAIAELDASERIAANSIWAHRTSMLRSVAHLQADRLEQALEESDRAVRLLAAPEPLIQSMLCFAKLNRPDRAHDALRRLCDADPEISWAQVESLVRDFYCGSNAVDEYVDLARKVWDEA
jgi:TolB-like protein